ncbi:MAG: DNA-binding protein [Microbacteriaceae bacterium]|nr:DNA-binding protein [Microbacteriaceae bacterium]
MPGKLSTPPFHPCPHTHNRRMNDTNPTDPGAQGALGRFLTLADTAEILNVSASQAYALVRSGELPAIKIGGHGHWRVERSVLESYIEAKYEESRRMSLWNQSEYASLPEYSFDAGRRDQTRTNWT